MAIQKGGEKYDREKGCKWNIRNLKLYMVSKHGLEVVNQLFEDIKDMMIRTLLSVQKIMINDKHCFELSVVSHPSQGGGSHCAVWCGVSVANPSPCLDVTLRYGYDILIDQDFKPWLLEVNASPSLSAETKDDYDRKFSMLEDVINIIELEKKCVSGFPVLRGLRHACMHSLTRTHTYSLTRSHSHRNGGPEQEQVGGFDLIVKQGHNVHPDKNSLVTTSLGEDPSLSSSHPRTRVLK